MVIWYLNEMSKMDKPFLGCRVAKFRTAEQQGQPARAMGSTPIVGRGRGLWRWWEVMLEGVPPVGSPPDSPKVTGEPTGRPMEDTEVAREVNCPQAGVRCLSLVAAVVCWVDASGTSYETLRLVFVQTLPWLWKSRLKRQAPPVVTCM